MEIATLRHEHEKTNEGYGIDKDMDMPCTISMLEVMSVYAL
jgi:hypothetical protein